jgi:hypothetical protein
MKGRKKFLAASLPEMFDGELSAIRRQEASPLPKSHEVFKR